MNPADERLKALFATDEPPARDPAFSAEVMAQLARRRCLQDLAFLGSMSLVGAISLWAAWPVLQPALTALSGQLAPAAVAAALALSALAILGGRNHEQDFMEEFASVERS
ncbi:hypothetical protein [Phenylobacterium soli]|uniref:Uncharacterized protein n=1 Tax=Phenylobacterium soli TaxID=2170551 RepID=A0A328AKP8_9CAUL|nr:hypothetical protein [Phenylobacterium soli]RAK55169.1 hypothetical protein DJ017_11880 [Phenylobacterium soli]